MPVFEHVITDVLQIVTHRYICDFATADRFITDSLTASLGRAWDAQLTLDWWLRARDKRPDHFTAEGRVYTIRDEPLTAAELEAAILSAGPTHVTAVQRWLMPAEPLRYPQRVIIAFTGPCDAMITARNDRAAPR